MNFLVMCFKNERGVNNGFSASSVLAKSSSRARSTTKNMLCSSLPLKKRRKKRARTGMHEDSWYSHDGGDRDEVPDSNIASGQEVDEGEGQSRGEQRCLNSDVGRQRCAHSRNKDFPEGWRAQDLTPLRKHRPTAVGRGRHAREELVG
eukprot:CAMPEP_0206216374 /NCGR_PEP_ID=MMETSP0047_2-20121206/2687_1 /ASSEMBLY_ACC=CAM_ASM_000192 /TAXON_ID=195065 /ORGANISM="Chroomonas mesostigmatica_cf, Strain CCMP1168" /LENGTH=147 /DNA_ID=CAMNT_0053638717 /DNA_START=342 /DNA_END=780 /DNA_ORIENTATION=-